jgi:hypothetical protein
LNPVRRWRRPACAILAAGLSAALAACAKPPPTDAEIAAAIQGCGIPPGGASVTFEKDRTFSVRGREDISYKQFTCVIEWAQKRGFKSRITLVAPS